MGKKKELGKGIRALLNTIEESSEEKADIVKHLSRHIEEINIENIEVNPYQPRAGFDNKNLNELAESIKTYGIIQPITVRDMKDGKFQLISGERRLRASKIAGLLTIPAFVRIADDHLMLEMALVENIQRENLNALEVALSYQRLISEFNFTHESLSKRVGKRRSTVTNYIRLLKLPPEIQRAIKEESISMGHARAILGIPDISQQLRTFKETVQQDLSVRALERLIQNQSNKPKIRKSISKPIDPEIQKLERKLSDKIGYRAQIKRNEQGKGEIRIVFRSDEDLNDILESLLDE